MAKVTGICEEMGIAIEQIIRIRKIMHGEESDDTGLTLEQESIAEKC